MIEDLGNAIRAVAEKRGLDLGEMAARNGSIVLSAWRGEIWLERSRIEMRTPGFTWATGSWSDVGEAAETAAAWRSEMPLTEFATRFPFITLDEFALARENGTMAALQWSHLLTDELYAGQRPVLVRVHADELLRDLFAVVSMGTVRLRSDPLGVGIEGHILIAPVGAGYEVTVVGMPEAGRIVASLDELVTRLREHLAFLRPPF